MLCMCVCSASVVEPVLSLSDWLDGIQKTVKHSIQQCRDPESQGDIPLRCLPCYHSSIIIVVIVNELIASFSALTLWGADTICKTKDDQTTGFDTIGCW